MLFNESLLSSQAKTLSRNVYVISDAVARRAITLLHAAATGVRPNNRTGNNQVDEAVNRHGSAQFVVLTHPDHSPKVFIAQPHRDNFEVVEELVFTEKGISVKDRTRKWNIDRIAARFTVIDELAD
jgi:hypothetical protein